MSNTKQNSPQPTPPANDAGEAAAAAQRKHDLASANGKNGAHKKGLTR